MITFAVCERSSDRAIEPPTRQLISLLWPHCQIATRTVSWPPHMHHAHPCLQHAHIGYAIIILFGIASRSAKPIVRTLPRRSCHARSRGRVVQGASALGGGLRPPKGAARILNSGKINCRHLIFKAKNNSHPNSGKKNSPRTIELESNVA